jgi:peptidoglycan/LPS O-acetylase OafA/YrhL
MNKLLPLESLRGVAAILVALLHFQPAPMLRELLIVRNSDLMVDLFFVLSGFVISFGYWEKIKSINDVVAFQKKRFLRLYPLHFATLLAFVVLECARYVTQLSIRPAFENSGLVAFVSHALLVQSFTGHNSAFNAPSWSISTEFYTYFLFAVFLLTRWALVLIVVTIGVMFALLVSISPQHPLDGPVSMLFPRCIYSYFLGVMAYKISRLIAGKIDSFLPAILMVASVVSICKLGKTPFEIYVPVLFAMTIAALAVIHPEAWLAKALSAPVLVWTGTISYSIYMTHGLIWGLIGNLLRLATETSVVNGVRVFHLSNGEQIAITLISTLLLLGVSYASYQLVEARYRAK